MHISDFFEYYHSARDFSGRCSLETAKAQRIRASLHAEGVFSNGQQDLKDDQQDLWSLAILFWLAGDELVLSEGMPTLIRHKLINHKFVVEDDGAMTATDKLRGLMALTNNQIVNN